MDAAKSTDPEVGLTAVVALRQLVEVLEELQVDNARVHGWSLRDIARRLGVTKQAVHYKHGFRQLLHSPRGRSTESTEATGGLCLATERVVEDDGSSPG